MRQALLYLPGVDGTGRLLHRQPGLEQQYAVQCVSYPQLEPIGYEQLAASAAALLEKGPGKLPAVILTESFGGGVALTLALQRPDLVSRLVLVNSFAYFPRRAVIHLAAALGRFFPAKPSHPGTRGMREVFFFATDIPKHERDAWWERTGTVPMSAYGWRFRLITSLDLRPRLREIQVPALVVASLNDRVVPAAAGLDLARRLPRAHLIRCRVGHAALIHPTIDIARFLAEPRYWDWPNRTAAETASR